MHYIARRPAPAYQSRIDQDTHAVPYLAIAAGTREHCLAAALAYGAGATVESRCGHVRLSVYSHRGRIEVIGGGVLRDGCCA